MIAYSAVPDGPDREAVIKHWTYVLNSIVHYIANDTDGPQRQEVYWMLEKIRRAVHVTYLDHKKMSSAELTSSVDDIFDHIHSIINTAWATKPAKRTAAIAAAEELRRVVKRKSD